MKKLLLLSAMALSIGSIVDAGNNARKPADAKYTESKYVFDEDGGLLQSSSQRENASREVDKVAKNKVAMSTTIKAANRPMKNKLSVFSDSYNLFLSAIATDDVTMAQVLLDSEADMAEVFNRNGKDILASVLEDRSKGMASLLLSHPKIIVANEAIEYAIYIAIRVDRMEMLTLLLDHANFNLNTCALPPLVQAVRQLDKVTVELLLKNKKINKNSKQSGAQSAVEVAEGLVRVIEATIKDRDPSHYMTRRHKENLVVAQEILAILKK